MRSKGNACTPAEIEASPPSNEFADYRA